MKKFSWFLTPLPIALLFCLANAFKPAAIDDAAYVWYAREIVRTPAYPFGPPPDGFQLIWYERGQGAFTLLTPMVVPYWLALGLSLFDENLVLLKLWLFPFCLLFTVGLQALLRRYAPGNEKPLLAVTVFSPVFLPSLNLMVDVPAMALLLAALAVFHKALDPPKTNWRLVLLAGLLAGFAAQTKYTGATSVASIFLYATFRGRRPAGFVAAILAISVFAGWEVYLERVYGRSHFLLQFEQRRAKPVDPDGSELATTLRKKAAIALPLIGVLGSVAAPLLPLLLLGWRCSRKIVLVVAGYLIAGFSLIALVPTRWAVFNRDPPNIDNELSFSTIFPAINGVFLVLLLATTCCYLGFRGWSRWRIRLRSGCAGRLHWFPIGWLGIELAAYFALSPFAATRRVMGIYLASTLLIGRLLTATARTEERRRLVEAIAALGVGIGVLFAWTDYRDAVAERNAVLDSVALIRQQPGGDRPIWFCGHWGFQYYAEREGLLPIYPSESTLNVGDWIVYPDTRLRPYGQLIVLESGWSEAQIRAEWFEAWPLRTNPEFYDGSPPIRHHEGYRLRATIFRVTKKFLAQPL